MTPDEQGIISALVAAKQNAGFFGWVAAAILTLLGWLGARVWGALHHRIKAAEKAVGSVEDKRREDTTSLHEKLDGHIERDIEMHDQVLSAMHEQTNTLGAIHASLERAIGERPTRAEVRDMVRRKR